MSSPSHTPGFTRTEGGTPETEKTARFLAHLLAALGSSATSSDLAAKAAAAAVEALGDWCAIWIRAHDSEELRLSGAHHREPEKVPLLQRVAEGWITPGRGHLRRELKDLKQTMALAIGDEARATEVFGSRERAGLAQRLGSASILLTPLGLDGHQLGLLAIGSADPQTALTERDINLATDIARQLSAAFLQSQQVEMAVQTSQQLALTALRLQSVIDSVSQGLFIVDAPQGSVVCANKAMAPLVGREIKPHTPAAEFARLIGASSRGDEPYRPEDLPWVRTARTGRPVESEEIVIARPDGQKPVVACNASPITDLEGKTIGAVVTLEDITDRQKFERQKDDFLEMVSHELRTPLASLKGSTQLLRRRAQSKSHLTHRSEEVDMLEIIDRQVSRLSRLVSDLMEFSTMQMGRLELNRSNLSLGALARDLVSQMEVLATDHDMVVSVHGETLVDADPDRIEQVLSNLISNAVKATSTTRTGKSKGKVEVGVRREGDSVVVAVRDFGMGISKDAQTHMFEELYRGRNYTHEGLGLGLYISKGIIDAHGGKIWLESEEGKGTAFYFSLPAVGGGDPVPANAPAEPSG